LIAKLKKCKGCLKADDCKALKKPETGGVYRYVEDIRLFKECSKGRF